MKLRYYIALIFTVLCASCDTSLDIKAAPDLDITTEKTTYKVGEVVNFKIGGDANILTFYSGQIGNDYNFREGRVIPAGTLTLSFSNNTQYGNQPDQFSILTSTNFSGTYNIDEIKKATWTDITSRFTLNMASTTYVSAGEIDISDLIVEGKPMYFVLRYIYDPAKGVGRTFGVRDFLVKSNTQIGLTTIANQTTAGFALHYFGPKETTGRSGITSTTITLRSNAAGNTADYTEDWCISNGLNVGSQDLGPDRPVKVKGTSEAKVQNFQYTYTTKGNYKVRFIVTNASIKEAKTVIKEMDIEVVE